jgi:hypothetical protein
MELQKERMEAPGTAPRDVVDGIWKYPHADEPVRQGDLLQFMGSPGKPTVDRCLVITADCDIKQQNYGQYLVCLRVVTLEAWFSYHWAEERLREFQGKSLGELCDKVNAQAKKHLGDKSIKIPSEALVSWLRRVGPGGIAEELGVEEGDRERWLRPLENMQRAITALETMADASPMRQMTTFRAAVTEKSLEQVHEAVRKDIDQKAKGLSQDVYLLPWMPEPDKNPSLVLLHETVAIREEDIRFMRSEALQGDCRLRVARLTETLKYSLSQAYGHMFSRIGLPEEIDNLQKLAAGDAQKIKLE